MKTVVKHLSTRGIHKIAHTFGTAVLNIYVLLTVVQSLSPISSGVY